MKVSPEFHRAQSDAFSEASRFVLPENWQEGRKLIPGITIDSKSTRDRDDAIRLTSYEDGHDVTVSIADVGSFISPTSSIAAYAEKMGETRYLRTGNITMIPPSISEDALSLLETKETPVLSTTLSFDNDGGVAGVGFSRDRIKPYRMSYGEVNKLTKGDGEPDEVNVFRAYEKFALGLLAQRKASGAFALFDPAKGLLTNEEGALVPHRKGVNRSGELIVQEFMILANTAVAEYMWRHDIPALFRNHHMQVAVNTDQALDILSSGSAEQIAALKQGFGRARYSTDARGHAALNLDAYTHWTSPLRRYADFANHANLVAHIEGREVPYPRDRLEDIAERLNGLQRERKAVHFEEINRAATAQRLGGTSLELSGLEGKVFYKVVKMARETGIAPEGLRTAIAERAIAGTLGSREFAEIIFSDHAASEDWRKITQAVLGHLHKHQSDATAVLNYAQQAGLVTSTTFDVTPSDLGFSCDASMRYEDGSEVIASANGQSKKAAQQQAAFSLLAKLAGHEIAIDSDAAPATPEALPEVAQDDAARVPNPKGYLLEFFQKQGGNPPTYSVEEMYTDGTKHIFQATVNIEMNGEGIAFSGRACTKKAAEAEAAVAAIAALRLADLAQETSEPRIVSDNPINGLQEWSQALKIALPHYAFQRTGANHKPTFECTVRVENPKGEIREFIATGASKQRAKTLAAQAALQAL